MMKVISIILGVLLAVGGVYCMLTPIATYSVLAWLIGLSMVIEGVAGIVTWSDRRRVGLANGFSLAGSIVSIILGVFLLGSYVLQFAVDAFIAYVIAIWLVVAGVARVVAAFGLRGQVVGSSWVLQVVLGVLIAILGIMCIFNPLSIAFGVGMMLGISIAMVGVDLVIAGFMA